MLPARSLGSRRRAPAATPLVALHPPVTAVAETALVELLLALRSFEAVDRRPERLQAGVVTPHATLLLDGKVALGLVARDKAAFGAISIPLLPRFGRVFPRSTAGLDLALPPLRRVGATRDHEGCDHENGAGHDTLG